jgi:hypothetical protein
MKITITEHYSSFFILFISISTSSLLGSSLLILSLHSTRASTTKGACE